MPETSITFKFTLANDVVPEALAEALFDLLTDPPQGHPVDALYESCDGYEIK